MKKPIHIHIYRLIDPTLLEILKHILIRQQELQTCKKIGYEFYCKELFRAKHKSKYSCESPTYYDLGPDIIKENCKLIYYFNRTDIAPTLLNGGNNII